jgi:hypothetical protein
VHSDLQHATNSRAFCRCRSASIMPSG